jgi:hypothetical protein
MLSGFLETSLQGGLGRIDPGFNREEENIFQFSVREYLLSHPAGNKPPAYSNQAPLEVGLKLLYYP